MIEMDEMKGRGKRGLLRVVFGRTMFFLLFIALQLAFFFWIYVWLDNKYQAWGYGSFALISAILTIHILNEKQNASFKMAWLIPVLLFPVFGTLFYVFVQLQMETKIFAKRIAEVQKRTDHFLEQDTAVYERLSRRSRRNANLSHYMKKSGGYPTAWKHPHKAEGTVTYTPLKGDIRLEDVDFGYTPEKLVLHNITLYAKPGQKIAFVGATGAGKTTITNLINRFYDIPDGKIRYDGINITKIRKPDLRRSLGVVLQDVNLFTGTVMENIRYGQLDATDEECMAAARLANADDFIQRLPEGYNTMLTGNGASLSQGQRQLISIARAAVADPPVMILDEATSSIDTRTEALVQEGMDNLMMGRTVFVIAHRLSTVRNSKAIMVLDHGHIIERGDHETLIAQKGVYYQLYTGAFELE